MKLPRTKYFDAYSLTQLPWYIGNQDKLHIAIWNCGMRPQPFWQMLKDIRITIRYAGYPVFVIKRGDIKITTLKTVKECKEIETRPKLK